jgi:hypothetical protein
MKHVTLLILAATLTLASCTTNVVVEGTVPTPLVRKVPVNVGVFYGENFKNFQHTEDLDTEGTFKINLGDQNLTFFQNLMTSMFDQVQILNDPEPMSAKEAGLDAIVIPKIEKYGFLTPGLSGLKFFSASIHYRITMMDTEGNQLADWTVVGYGKGEGGVFSSDDALGEATMLAIRDGGARISIGLPQQPKVAEWVATQGNSVNEN